jgi:hypothetical protein
MAVVAPFIQVIALPTMDELSTIRYRANCRIETLKVGNSLSLNKAHHTITIRTAMTNVYQAPSADLTENTVPYEGGGSLENGIAGNYEFSIGDIMSEAWEKTSGAKWTFWLAALLYAVFAFVVMFALNMVLGLVGIGAAAATGSIGTIIVSVIVTQIAQMAVVMPVAMGLFMIGLKRAVGAPTQATDIFGHFSKALPLLGTIILMYILVFIGTLLLILPGIYLMIAYWLAMPLIIEKNLGPWEALEASRKAITHHWFGFLGLGLVMMVIMLVALVSVIGLIWALPFMLIASGVVYRNVFGYEGSVSEA